MSEVLALADKHAERLKRMRRGVMQSAKAIHNDLLAQGYFLWEKGKGKKARWAHADECEFRTALLTLTYRPDVQWEPLHIKQLCDHYRKWAKRNKCQFSYVWVIEPHADGRPHYHMVFWVTNGKTPPLPDEQGWWPHGMSNAVWATSPVGYIAKYASKGHKHHFPDGARLWGAGGLTAAARIERTYRLAPKWLRDVCEPGALIRRAKTQIKQTFASGATAVHNVTAWVSSLTGLAFFSPWEHDGMSSNGVALRHRGYIEVFSPEGDFWRIRHNNPMEQCHAY